MQENKGEAIMNDWLGRRKISKAVIEDFGVHWGAHAHLEGGCIVIPIKTIDGQFSYNKYRRNPLSQETPKYLYDRGGKVTLFGADRLKGLAEGTTVLVTEGEMDALVAWSANIPAVSSTGGAMSFQAEWSEILGGKDVVLCFDNDGPGGEGMVRALKIIPWAKVLLLPDRPGVKDISDYVAAGGDLQSLLGTAFQPSSVEMMIEQRAERAALWKSVWFHDAYIKEHTKPVRAPRADGPKIVGDDVARAKAYPVDQLLEFNTRGKAICPFHNEKTPSLHLYRDQNRCYCFGGCGRGYDAIDIKRKLDNCGFREAVSRLQ